MSGRQAVSAKLAKAHQQHKKAHVCVADLEAQGVIAQPNSSYNEERYHSLFDNMLEGCQLIGFDWRYLYVNNTAARHGQCSKDELLGYTMMERYPGIEKTQMFAMLQRCMQERTVETMENKFVYLDGTTAWFELHMQPVPEGIFILSLDITARKQIEKAEQELMRMKDEFVANVSHELCTPLFAISGAVKLLQKQTKKDQAVQQEFVSIIADNVVRLKALVDDLLDLSRLEAGQLPLDLQEVDIKALIIETLYCLKVLATARHLTMSHELPMAPLLLKADRHRLQQVLVNLIGNAIKFSPEHRTIHVTAEMKDQRMTVKVIDQGAGIPAAALPKLFDKFYQINGSDSHAYGGTGLGLYISKRIIESHDGRMGVESEPDKGSTFYFVLPA
jgi:PAS domain S-box-containing protein